MCFQNKTGKKRSWEARRSNLCIWTEIFLEWRRESDQVTAAGERKKGTKLRVDLPLRSPALLDVADGHINWREGLAKLFVSMDQQFSFRKLNIGA